MKIKKVAKKYSNLLQEYGLSSVLEDRIKMIVSSYLLSNKLKRFDELANKIDTETLRKLHSLLNDGLLSVSCQVSDTSIIRALDTIAKLGENTNGFKESLIASISNSILYAIGVSRWSIDEFISDSALEVIITGEESVKEINRKMSENVTEKIIERMKSTWELDKKEFSNDLEKKLRDGIQEVLKNKLCVE